MVTTVRAPRIQSKGTLDPKAFAQHLEARVFAQGERFGETRTLYILNRGIVGRKGRVMRTNAVWGEDFILEEEVYLDKAPSVALTYVEVSWMARISLDAIMEQLLRSTL